MPSTYLGDENCLPVFRRFLESDRFRLSILGAAKSSTRIRYRCFLYCTSSHYAWSHCRSVQPFDLHCLRIAIRFSTSQKGQDWRAFSSSGASSCPPAARPTDPNAALASYGGRTVAPRHRVILVGTCDDALSFSFGPALHNFFTRSCP
jgi:hypothetical protein